MAAGFFISKSVGIVAIVLGVGAVATIIALSVVYAQEKNKVTDTADTPTTAATTTAATTSPTEAWNQWRLPTTLMPESYEVTLQPFLKPKDNSTYIFKGNSSVVFLCVEATNLILIHSNKLNYTQQGAFLASLQALDNSNVPAITRTWLETTTQYLVVQLESPLQQGQRYRLVSSFTGELADDLAGFYRSEYEDESGVRWVEGTGLGGTGLDTGWQGAHVGFGASLPLGLWDGCGGASVPPCIHIHPSGDTIGEWAGRRASRGTQGCWTQKSSPAMTGFAGRRVVATTQMQAADARKAFPCFDEPAMKANFTVTLIHPSDHHAISNMPPRSEWGRGSPGGVWGPGRAAGSLPSLRSPQAPGSRRLTGRCGMSRSLRPPPKCPPTCWPSSSASSAMCTTCQRTCW